MTAQAAARRESECWKCQAKVASAILCPRCHVIQHLPAGVDLFEVLGLPHRLEVDLADLEDRYHTASREVHPDRHQTAGAKEQSLSLAASAALNRAYRTLRDPVARGRYWLELHDVPLGENNNRVPPALAAEVFAVQEKLEEVRAAAPGDEALLGEVRALRTELADRLAALRADLVTGYAGAPVPDTAGLADLKRRLSEIAYLDTLLGDVDESLGEETGGADHRH